MANKDLVAGEVKKFVTDLAASLRTVGWRGVIEGDQELRPWFGVCRRMAWRRAECVDRLVLFMNAQTIMALAGMAGAVLRLGAYIFGIFVPATGGRCGHGELVQRSSEPAAALGPYHCRAAASSPFSASPGAAG